MMNRPIRILRRSPDAADQLPESLHPVMRRVFLNRGIGNEDALDLALARILPLGSFGALDDAVDLLCQHREQRSLITIVGDFDADGATATALLMRGLRDLGFPSLKYLLPDRFRYGYGLSADIVKVASADGPGLIITVDNGISSIEGVAAARELGIDVLVTDHHLPGAETPAANVILNPNLPGESFAGKTLAGVGVAFYLLAATARRLHPDGAKVAARYLDLVALGTVADVVPLDHNNRALVEQGLKRIRARRCCAGITALLEVAGRNPETTSASDLGFAAGPRLNAAGRLDDMSLGVECLLSDAVPAAAKIATQLDEKNRTRRDIEGKMEAEAQAHVERLRIDPNTGDTDDLPWGLCLFDEAWHQGVVGLLASRIKERVHRPVIAFAPASDTELKGSARSIPGLHIRDTLDRIATDHPDILSRFGGHAMAAGLSLDRDRFDDFAALFDAAVRETISRDTLQAAIHSDGELAADELSMPLAELLARGGPWGQGFPEPQFDGIFELESCRELNGGHLKMRVRPDGLGDGQCDGLGESLSAIAFRQSLPAEASHRLRMVYRLEVNEFRGRRETQLNVQLIQPA